MQKLAQADDRRFYVYKHLRASDGTVFYIGKGNGSRFKSKSGRNKHWMSIVNKHGYLIEIVQDCMTNAEACELEIALIKHGGSSLCNIAAGGEAGLIGMPLSKEHRHKLRMAKLGKKQSPEHAARSARAKVGKRQPRDAVEKMVAAKRRPVINSSGDIFPSASAAAAAFSQQLKINASQGNISMCCNGHRNEAYGKAWSYDTTAVPIAPTGISASMRRILCGNGMIFKSTMDATRWVKGWRGTANNQPITACARGEVATAYGHKWSYL